MNYLGLTDGQTVPSGYEHYLWISERCTDKIQWCRERKMSFTILPENWRSEEEIQAAERYLYHVKECILECAVSLLNDYHHTAYNKEEWRIMLGSWLEQYLGSFYDKYLKLLAAEKLGEEYECDLYELAGCTAVDYAEYRELLYQTDEFHLYQYSMLYEEMQPQHIHIRKKRLYEKPVRSNYPVTFGFAARKIYHMILYVKKYLCRTQDSVVLQNCYLPNRLILQAMCMDRRITGYFYDYNRNERKKLPDSTDTVWRNRKETLPAGADAFTGLAMKLLKQNLPVAYVEGFSFLHKKAERIFRYAMHPKAVFYACSSVSVDEVFKIYLMNIRKTNVKFCDIQHGGNYGIECVGLMRHEYEICDCFYTWGWEQEDRRLCQFKRMPAAKLLGKTVRHTQSERDILYVNYIYDKYISTPDRDTLYYTRNRQKEIHFFQTLSSGLQNRIVVRMFPEDYGWHTKEELEKNVPGICFDIGSDYYESLGRAKLVVLMSWCTTAVEALYVKKPVLVLYSLDHASELAMEDMELLERTGILVQTWEKLSEQLEKICIDIDAWWNDTARQEAVEYIKRKYIYMPEHPEKVWLDEFVSYCKDGE